MSPVHFSQTGVQPFCKMPPPTYHKSKMTDNWVDVTCKRCINFLSWRMRIDLRKLKEKK